MNYRQIIGEAWLFTQENKKLIVWYSFIPSILVTLVGILYFLYQFYAFKSSPLFENWERSFTTIALSELFNIAREHIDSLIPIIIAVAILAVMYFFLPPVAEGAIIQLIARKKNQQDVRMKDGLKYGFLNFLPLFNYFLVSRSYNLITIGGEISLIARNVGPSVAQTFLPLFILIFIIGLISSFLFIFTEYYIVIDGCKVSEAMSKSAVLVVRHWDTSIVISMLMLLIGIRILLQIIFVLLVPIGILTLIYFIAASSIPLIGLVIGGVLGLAALIFASYLGAIVHVFTSSVWVFTFLDLTGSPEVSAREKTT